MRVNIGDLPSQCNYYCASILLGFNPEEERQKGYPKICKLLEQKEIRLGKGSHLIDTYSILQFFRRGEEAREKLEQETRKLFRQLIAEFKELKKDIHALMQMSNPHGLKAPKCKRRKV